MSAEIRVALATFAIAVLIAVLGVAGALDGGVPPTAACMHDGRCRPCNIIDSVGVTEHLDAYQARCS